MNHETAAALLRIAGRALLDMADSLAEPAVDGAPARHPRAVLLREMLDRYSGVVPRDLLTSLAKDCGINNIGSLTTHGYLEFAGNSRRVTNKGKQWLEEYEKVMLP